MVQELETGRLRLRQWTLADLDNFAMLHGDGRVMRDLGGPISRSESQRKLLEYIAGWDENGFGRWCVTDQAGRFLGYVGVNRITEDHPLGEHCEIGWRLHPAAWGKGFAVEAAIAALKDAFLRSRLTEVLAYTAPDNMQSQSVIAKLPFERVPSSDFCVPWEPLGSWHGLVWRTNKSLTSYLFQSGPPKT